MATLQVRNKSYRILFCHDGQRHTFTVGKVSRKEADLATASVERILLRVEQKLLLLPAGVGIVEFVKNDGRAPTTDGPLPRRAPMILALPKY